MAPSGNLASFKIASQFFPIIASSYEFHIFTWHESYRQEENNQRRKNILVNGGFISYAEESFFTGLLGWRRQIWNLVDETSLILTVRASDYLIPQKVFTCKPSMQCYFSYWGWKRGKRWVKDEVWQIWPLSSNFPTHLAVQTILSIDL